MKNKDWNRQLNYKVQLLAIIYNKLIIMSLKFVNYRKKQKIYKSNSTKHSFRIKIFWNLKKNLLKKKLIRKLLNQIKSIKSYLKKY